jgi:hypothetical protein
MTTTTTRPACACHGRPLDGGPVLYWCPVTGSNVPAADIHTEHTTAVTR